MPTIFADMRTAEAPCDSYLGNVCTGFGGETVCYICGWDLYEHDQPGISLKDVTESLEQKSSKNPGAELDS